MSTPFSFGKIEFNFAPGTADARRRPETEDPFRLAVLGDFSGRSNRAVVESIERRRAVHLDCDNFDQNMAQWKALLRLPAPWEPSGSIELHFATVEDFHPDKILAQLKPLAALLEKRQRLLNPSAAAEAAAELQSLLALPSSPGAARPAVAESEESTNETLARLLGKAPPRRSPPAPASTGINHLIRNIVAPSLVPAASAEQTAILSTLDLELARRLRAILHHPEFQDLESAWRGVDLLVRQFGAEENLKLHLIDISKEELTSDLKARDELAATGTCKTLRAQFTDAPLAALLGQYTFRPTLAELQTLGRMAKISSVLGAPFLAGAAPEFVGCDSFNAHPDPDDWTWPMDPEVREAWRALRELPEASSLGLALPRFLARQPYGRQSDPISAFPFEELPDSSAHESYLWGNPAILCGYVLVDAFQAEGWEMPAAGSGEVGDLPVYQFKEDGETKVKACAEAWMSDRAGEAILNRGLMPVLSIKGRDAVRLANLQSISSRSSALRGPWG